jgi:hypothetical protein
MAYHSALDPTATWPGYPYEVRLPPQGKDADHFGLDKVKRRLTEYLAVVRLRALIAQEAEMEQIKAQEVVLRGPCKVTKTIKAPILLCVSHLSLTAR